MNSKGSSGNNQGLQLKTIALCNILLIYCIDLTVTVLHISFFGFRWSHQMPVISCCFKVALSLSFISPGPTFIPTLQKHLEIYNFIVSVQLILNKFVNSCSVVCDSLQTYGLQHPRLPCPSPMPWACSNSCPLSRWCHPTISSSVIPFSCLQSFPASGSFLMSQFFASGGWSIGFLASASVLPMNIQDWSPLGWTGWISLQSTGLPRVFSSTTVQKHQFFGTQFLYGPTLTSHISLMVVLMRNHSFD